MTQKQLADMLDVSSSSIRLYELGKLDAGEITQEEYDAWKASFGR